jgi:hypothetical protein
MLETASSTPRRDPMPDAASRRIQALALDIAHRLRPVCAHMPDDELLELSTRMATVELKYFEETAVPQPPRRRAANG